MGARFWSKSARFLRRLSCTVYLAALVSGDNHTNFGGNGSVQDSPDSSSKQSLGSAVLGIFGFVLVFGCAIALTCCYIARSFKKDEPDEEAATAKVAPSHAVPPVSRAGVQQPEPARSPPRASHCTESTSIASQARKASRQRTPKLQCSQGHSLVLRWQIGNTCDICGKTGTRFHCSLDCDWDCCKACWDAHNIKCAEQLFLNCIKTAFDDTNAAERRAEKASKLWRSRTTSELLFESRRETRNSDACDKPFVDIHGRLSPGKCGTDPSAARQTRRTYSEGCVRPESSGTCSPSFGKSIQSVDLVGCPSHGECEDSEVHLETLVTNSKRSVDVQLQSTFSEDLAMRKKNFKFLCAKWHPDKHSAADCALATEVFQHLQEQKPWYLEERFDE